MSDKLITQRNGLKPVKWSKVKARSRVSEQHLWKRTVLEIIKTWKQLHIKLKLDLRLTSYVD